MKPVCFVGFDTSNYTTSAAVCTEEGKIIANIKAPLPVKEGECGLRQSDAVFAHVKNLPTVTQSLREAILPYDVKAVGYSACPRQKAPICRASLRGVLWQRPLRQVCRFPRCRARIRTGILWRQFIPAVPRSSF